MPTLNCILGRVSSPTPDVTVAGKPAGNSSKWIFDVVHEGSNPITFEVRLLEYRSGHPRPASVFSPSAVPLNADAARAFIYFPDPDKLTVVCEPRSQASAGSVRFRVTVDALHTLMR
jgi:hypothetical protein